MVPRHATAIPPEVFLFKGTIIVNERPSAILMAPGCSKVKIYEAEGRKDYADIATPYVARVVRIWRLR